MTITYTKITPGALTPESIIESSEVVTKQFTFGSLSDEKQKLILAKQINLNSLSAIQDKDTEFDAKIAEKDNIIETIENLP